MRRNRWNDGWTVYKFRGTINGKLMLVRGGIFGWFNHQRICFELEDIAQKLSDGSGQILMKPWHRGRESGMYWINVNENGAKLKKPRYRSGNIENGLQAEPHHALPVSCHSIDAHHHSSPNRRPNSPPSIEMQQLSANIQNIDELERVDEMEQMEEANIVMISMVFLFILLLCCIALCGSSVCGFIAGHAAIDAVNNCNKLFSNDIDLI